MLRFLGLPALAAATLIALSAGQALANHVHCGDTITQDTTLDSDLIDCPGDGIVIGADNITLDLNGHTIDGDGNGSFCEAGVVNGEDPFRCVQHDGGHDGVVIRDGVVREFGIGVSFGDASRNVVRSVSVGASGFRGILISGESAENIVTHNVVVAGDFDYGVDVFEAGPDNQVRQNSVSGNLAGIALSGFAGGTEIKQNSIFANASGIFLSDSFGDTTIRANFVSDNSVGIWLLDARHTRIEGNRVVRSGGVTDLVHTNVIGDGMHIDGFETEIVGNVASRNAADGIDVVEFDNTLTENSANRNGDFGIEAVPGVIDGGGNRAKHNGNPLQCLNVACNTKGKPKK
jgi:parallel beta-helix repeat protein